MKSVNSLISLLKKKREFKPELTEFWRGARILIRTPDPNYKAEERGFFSMVPDDTVIFHDKALEIGKTLSEVIRIIARDEVIGYNGCSKFPIIDHLVTDLPSELPSEALIQRAIKIALKAYKVELYFAYGSNMSLKQMRHRCPNATFLTTDTVSGYEFILNRQEVATIVPTPEGSVEGAVFAVSPDCVDSLDRYEGVALGLYTREQIVSQNHLQMFVYMATDRTPSKPVRSSYLNGIMGAAEELGLSPQHLNKLKNFWCPN